MAPIDPAIKQNYIDLHESTGEPYESIAGRAASQDDKELASWLRSRAKGEERHHGPGTARRAAAGARSRQAGNRRRRR